MTVRAPSTSKGLSFAYRACPNHQRGGNANDVDRHSNTAITMMSKITNGRDTCGASVTSLRCRVTRGQVSRANEMDWQRKSRGELAFHLACSDRRSRHNNADDDSGSVSLKERLENLLQAIPSFLERAGVAVGETQERVQRVFSSDHRQGVRNNVINDDDRHGGDDNQQGRNKNKTSNTNTTEEGDTLPLSDELELLQTTLGNVSMFAVEALTPWDFDRHDFGVTFVHTWIDDTQAAARPAGFAANSAPPYTRNRRQRRRNAPPTTVKLTSTLKPLEGEWKLTARTKLATFANDKGIVFGKAGLYLAGDQSPFIGIEADRIWSLGSVPNTWIFANANYRNSRAPMMPVIRASVGVQHRFKFARGWNLTLRAGMHPLEPNKWFVTPTPNGGYF